MKHAVLNSLPRAIEEIQPHEPTMFVPLNPATLPSETLLAMRKAAEPMENEGDAFRAWLRECVARELGRRIASEANFMEPDAWALPWHRWNDEQLVGALAASYTWLRVGCDDVTARAFDELHRAVVTVVCTRLREFHDCIMAAEQRKG